MTSGRLHVDSSSSYCYAQEMSLILQNVIAFYRTLTVHTYAIPE